MKPAQGAVQKPETMIASAKRVHHFTAFFGNRVFWLCAVIPLLLLGFAYFDSLAYMVNLWVTDENYGHGFFVPLISLYLIWKRRHSLQEKGLQGSSWGIVIVLVGMALYVIGELATLYVVLHFSLWLVVVGLLVSAIGLRGVWVISFPLFYLLTMIPLPQFLYQGLSAKLQLLSSALGVGCLQLVGVTAFREGNVIDLGPIQLQVVDACSGLRYLFPLTSLALLCAYLFKDRMWKRAVLFLSSIPISIFLNGFRIGMIGVLVELYGQRAAEGFYHLFEGWVLFLTSLALLLLEMWGLSRIGANGATRPLLDMFHFEAEGADRHVGVPPKSYLASSVQARSTYLYSLGVLVLLALTSAQLVVRDDLPPPRQSFLDFPMNVGNWAGKSFAMEAKYVDELRFDDYLLADYWDSYAQPINLYVAYYRSQKKSQSAHSPQTCIPGGGWEIATLHSIELAPAADHRGVFRVNRVLIQKADQKQVVLYWFKQRERTFTNEYLVKLYLIWDALTRQRTDGALIRLTSTIGPGDSETVIDSRLIDFAKLVQPHLVHFVPD